MKCNRCNRKLNNPYISDGALNLGRVCARKLGTAKPEKAVEPKPEKVAKPKKLSKAKQREADFKARQLNLAFGPLAA